MQMYALLSSEYEDNSWKLGVKSLLNFRILFYKYFTQNHTVVAPIRKAKTSENVVIVIEHPFKKKKFILIFVQIPAVLMLPFLHKMSLKEQCTKYWWLIGAEV